MKIRDFIEYMQKSVNRTMKDDQIAKMVQKILEVKNYMSIKDKKVLVEGIVDECILYEDGIFKFDEIEKYVCFTMRVIEAYTNLELSDDMEDDYDLLCESNLLNTIVNAFKDEYDSINILLQMRSDYILSSNTIEAQFGKFLEGISDKVDVLTEALATKVGEFNLSELLSNINPETITKLLSIVKSVN